VKKLRWTKPWFLVSGATGEGTKDLSYAIMEFLEKRKTPSPALPQGGGRKK